MNSTPSPTLDTFAELRAGTTLERRPRRKRLVAVAVLVILLGGASGWLAYAHSYQPWQPGFAGMWEGHQIVGITDGIRETGLIVTARPGQTGWFAYSLELAGSHDVKVLGADDFPDPSEVKFKWQVLHSDIAASPDTATTRPVTVRPGEILTLWVMATRPADCGEGSSTSFTNVGLRWSALGFHHVYYAPITVGGPNGAVPLYLCYPDSALKHIYRAVP